MAIKERKQITGTTEQIDAYEGHEGQIVWDKDKKTFVGMSGTAGENYPLASQAYVDNQFLPLTGGNITGELIVDTFGSLVKQDVPGYEELVLQAYDRANQWTGGFLTLRGHNGSVEEERGSFLIGARSKEGNSAGMLLGTPSGKLFWSGNEVLRVTGSGPGWLRYSDGLQLCYGSAQIPASGISVLNFQLPFRDGEYRVYTQIIGSDDASRINYNVLAAPLSTSSVKLTGIVGNGVGALGLFWMAIGYWG